MDTTKVLAVATFGIVATTLLISGASAPATADAEYQISVSGSIDTPTREVNLQGATYEVSAIGKAETGDILNVTVSAPSSERLYRVYLYNSDREIVKGNTGTGNATVAFDLSGLDPGTYMFAVQEQGANKRIHPLVINGYDTTVNVPTSATVGDTISVDVSTTQLRDNVTNDRVEVVVAGQNTQTREVASNGGDTYTATVNTESFTAGTYRIYANVRGENIVFNQQEIFGISDANTLALSTRQTTSSDSDSKVGSNQGEVAATTAQTSTTTVSTTDGPTGDIITLSTETPDRTSSRTSKPAAATTAATTTGSNVLTPSTESPTTSPTTVPGFGFQVLGIVLVALALIARTQT